MDRRKLRDKRLFTENIMMGGVLQRSFSRGFLAMV
jgi:hypothetical protein